MAHNPQKYEFTNPALETPADTELRIYKHSRRTRVMHEIMAICTVLLALTGFAMFFGLKFESHWVAWLHSLLGSIFIAVPIFWATTNFSHFSSFVGTISSFGKNDWGWVKAPMGGYLDPFIGRKDNPSEVPPQGKYNAGQKVMAIAIMVFGVALSCSGILMLLVSGSGFFGFSINIGAHLVNMIWRFHLIFAIIMSLSVAVHAFLASIPENRGELKTMFGSGYADPDYAIKHHPEWLDKQVTVLRNEPDPSAEDGDLPALPK